MQLQILAGTLLLGRHALAVPAPLTAVKSHPPNINSLGTLQTLKYNDLGPQNNGTAAVLVHDHLSSFEAQARCYSIGESLYLAQELSQANGTELAYQLDYLVHVQDLRPNETLWVSQTAHNECRAFSLGHREVVSVPCGSKLPALCTSDVRPTTDQDRTAANTSKISIESDGYRMTGYRDGRSFRFLGVPFADAPVKELRFAPPRPYSGPRDIDATKMSNSCIQSVSGYGTLDNGGISEDCLYLNVYTPVLPAQTNKPLRGKPVAVYLYGGAFTMGTSAMVDYDGGNFASRNDIVVVTLNYRVGALGWLTIGNSTTGNYGVRDQIMALKWVKQHIEAFGGDPSQVTIFGQSAGGQSAIALLSSSAAHGLFSGAIVQSAPVDLPWFTRGVYNDIVTPRISSAVGCNGTTSENALLSCLRSIPATKYLDNSTEFKAATAATAKVLANQWLHSSDLLASIEPMLPIVDDTGSGVIDDQFHTLLSEDRLPNRVPVIFTTVADEAALYVNAEVTKSLGSSKLALAEIFTLAYPSSLAKALIASNAFLVNPNDTDSARNVAAEALTHSEWTCPQSYLLNIATTNITNATTTAPQNTTLPKPFPHLYQLSIPQGHIQTIVNTPPICSPNPDKNATCHSADVLLIWGTLNSKTQNVSPYYSTQDIQHSQLLNDIFSAFFRTRNPNPDVETLGLRGPAYRYSYEIFGERGYHMPEYQGNSDRVVASLGVVPGVTVNPGRTAKCRVFEEQGFSFQKAGLTI
ncbi:putative cholinesterase [Aspergillus homomorphus CBS 101889]|uniref:Carboxylesterase n=1 Tax=Aspergillus homomorphus (strain CBS 101889) TaxID=1450537 RepID=A0A395I070_ASPHC|nr:carboxylesterase [Aspergillus homomorphus CBS 101889]RAL11924.1 carboxylesterase [Aspergillus homomorphus CBS 101889]